MPLLPTKGPARFPVTATLRDALDQLIPSIREERRRRPLYFDGRFLAARDLTREQDYFLARQADLGRAGGFGVVAGLLVRSEKDDVIIQPGHGVTPSGEMVVLDQSVTINVGQISTLEAIHARLGVSRALLPRIGRRSGLFVLAIRPVEYEANPIAQYPTSLDGERGVHNGDIVEATAVTLIPYPDLGEPTELRFRRSHAAREIFVDRVKTGFVTDALPLAMVAVDRGRLLWVDPYLVRREIGAEAGDILGVSGAPLALREAHLLQYDAHLADVMRQHGGNFAASQHFLVLPAAGRMPRASIDADTLTQRYFPAELDVDVSLVPEDEIGALLEESRALPPIDLNDSADLAATSVLVLVGVARQDLPAARQGLVGKRRKLPPRAPNLLAKLRPIERIVRLPSLPRDILPLMPVISTEDQAWRQLLGELGDTTLWFVRRRNLAEKASILPEILADASQPPPPPPPAEAPADLRERIKKLGHVGLEDNDAKRVDPRLWDVVKTQLGSLESAVEKDVLVGAALVELTQAPDVVDDDGVRAHAEIVAERMEAARTGFTGALADAFHERPLATKALVRSGALPEVVARFAPPSGPAATKLGADVAAVEAESTSEAGRLAAHRQLLLGPQVVDGPPEDLLDLARKLVRVGIHEADARRVEPRLWEAVVRTETMPNPRARQLIAVVQAAFLIDLGLVAPVADDVAADSSARALHVRFVKSFEEANLTRLETLVGSPLIVTEVLVRSGSLPEVMRALGALDDAGATAWFKRLQQLVDVETDDAEKRILVRLHLGAIPTSTGTTREPRDPFDFRGRPFTIPREKLVSARAWLDKLGGTPAEVLAGVGALDELSSEAGVEDVPRVTEKYTAIAAALASTEAGDKQLDLISETLLRTKQVERLANHFAAAGLTAARKVRAYQTLAKSVAARPGDDAAFVAAVDKVVNTPVDR